MGSIKIAPSVLSADMANLKGELDKIAGADYVHFDVMDGHFTGNLTFGVDILKAVKRSTNVPVDAHLMVSNPDETVDWYADAGADMITVHYEASTHLHRTLTHLQQRGVKAGVVLNPATPVCVLESIIDVVDMVLLMSVNPGFGGQSFIPGTIAKLHELKAMCERHGVSPSSRSTVAFLPRTLPRSSRPAPTCSWPVLPYLSPKIPLPRLRCCRSWATRPHRRHKPL